MAPLIRSILLNSLSDSTKRQGELLESIKGRDQAGKNIMKRIEEYKEGEKRREMHMDEEKEEEKRKIKRH